MRRTFAAALLLLAAACANEAPRPEDATERRTPIAVEYVRAESLVIRAAPRDDAPLVARYDNGESVSVLSRKGGWCEVRTAGGSGWAHAADLASAAEAKRVESDTVNPRFLVAPAPVTQPGAHGAIHLVASVNSDGEIVSVDVESDTTGSANLLQRNVAALRRARFVPIVRHGRRTPFTYDYHVSY